MQAGIIHHSNRGSQYCSIDYQAELPAAGVIISMSGKGNCFDNAMVETFFKTLKSELIWRTSFLIRAAGEAFRQRLFVPGRQWRATSSGWSGCSSGSVRGRGCKTSPRIRSATRLPAWQGTSTSRSLPSAACSATLGRASPSGTCTLIRLWCSLQTKLRTR